MHLLKSVANVDEVLPHRVLRKIKWPLVPTHRLSLTLISFWVWNLMTQVPLFTIFEYDVEVIVVFHAFTQERIVVAHYVVGCELLHHAYLMHALSHYCRFQILNINLFNHVTPVFKENFAVQDCRPSTCS